MPGLCRGGGGDVPVPSPLRPLGWVNRPGLSPPSCSVRLRLAALEGRSHCGVTGSAVCTAPGTQAGLHAVTEAELWARESHSAWQLLASLLLFGGRGRRLAVTP